MSESRALFRELLRKPWADSPFSLDEWLIEAAQNALGKSSSLAEAYAEVNSKRVYNALARLHDEHVGEGRTPAFRVVDSSRRLMQLQSELPSRSKAAKHRLMWAALRWLDDLDSRQYEFAGAMAADLIGARKRYVTPGGNEGGVDFYALVPAQGPSDIFHGDRRMMRVVGQSKKYSAPASVEKVRDFSNVLDSVRARAAHMEAKTPRWFHEASGPIVGWMIAHSGHQSGFATLCRQRGILMSDDRDLASNIVCSKAIPLGLDGTHLAQSLTKRLEDLTAENDAHA